MSYRKEKRPQWPADPTLPIPTEMDHTQSHFDIAFSVPFVHRLRFTRDLWDREEQVLLDLLVAPPGRPVRAQFWLDEGLSECHPQLKQRIWRLARRDGALELAGPVQWIPAGEASKNDVHLLERILKVIHEHDLDRQSYIVAVGGGAVLDVVGFAAAIAHRGIRLVRVPTTTLSQADSGVGVKNGINLFQKKNWLGAFAVPWGVINDYAMLETLSDRDFRAGFSEAVKVALLKDAPFFEGLARRARCIAERDSEASAWAIRQSALWHLRHITAGGDTFEMTEARPLDFGHWSAHRLESLSEFTLRHGEAVAIGVAIDTIYSVLRHGLLMSEGRSVLQCLRDLGFSLQHPLLETAREDLFAGLEEFRQHLGGRLTVTMLEAVGKPINVHEIDRTIMNEAIDRVLEFALVSDD